MIITGTNGNDAITGTAGGDVISSGNGNDTINGTAGNDIIDAGNGDDKVNGGAGIDLIFGGNGNDTLDGGSGSDVLSGGNGNDILIYGASENLNAVDIYDGGNGQDTLRLVVSQSMASSAAFVADIAALQTKLAHGSATYLFNSFNLLVTDIEKLQIVVEPNANHAPIAVADVASTNEDTTLTIIGSALLANDTDVDVNDTKTIVSVQAAQHGTVSLNSSGNVVFTAEANYSGVASFTYTMKDGAGATSTATVTVNVAAVNDAPTATNLSAGETYTEDTLLNLTDIVVSDVDSANVTVKLALSNPAAGTLSTSTSGGVTSTYNALTGVWSASGATADVNALLAGATFNPAANFNGSFSIATSVSDGVAPPVTGTKNFSGVAVNDAPTATNLSAAETYTEDSPLNLIDIVAADIDSSTLTVTLTLSNPATGALSTASSGAVTSTYAGGVWSASGATADVNALLAGVKFSPAANFNGTFSIATSVSDGTAAPLTGTKAFHGVAVNDAPVAVADILAATEDSAITYTRAQLLGNDTDIDNTISQLSIKSVTSGAGGTAVLNADGSVTFTPTHDFNGAATFTYTVTDGALTSTPAMATVNVAPVATAPTITHGRIETDVTSAPIALNIQINDPDTSDTLASTVQITGVPSEYRLTAGAQSADDSGVWIVNLSDVAGLALQLRPDATADKQTIALSITASSFDHADVAQKTEVLNIQINDPGVKVAADGYIADALVFVDKADGNGVYNGILDLGESFTYTGSDGTFSLDTSGGQLVLQSVHGGGHNTIDVLTGLPFNGTLKAPSGSSVVTPLTNLIVAVAGAGGDTVAAEASVKAALGLSDSVNLTTLDPIAATVSAAPGAADVLAASIQVQATVAQLSAATGASAEAVIGAIAHTVTAGNADLGAPSTVSALATAVNNTLPPEQQLSAADLDAIAQVVQESNAQISSSLANTTDLSQVAQAAQVAFNDTTQALSDAANGAGTTTFSSVQNDYTGTALEQKIDAAPLTLTGTEVADTLTGGDGNDLIFGLGGNDTLKGGAGDDTISGGAGKDALTGGAGNDTLDGGADFDRAIYTEATGGITVHLGAGTATGAGVGTDTLISIDGVIGGNFNDYLDGTGYTGSTGLPGGIIGFTEFEGGAGDDTIIGGSNVQGHALTRVSYLGASAGVTVDIQSGQAHGTAPGDVANVGHDTISNILNVWGSNYDDTLLGSDNGSGSFEAFEGRRGNDFIDGRGGYDVVVYATDLTTTTGITVNMAAGTVTGDATVGTDTLRNVEAVRGTNFADYYNASNFGATGTANIGSLGTFNDFQGGGGDDVVLGNGNTRVNYSSALAGVTVNLQTDLNQAGVTATNVVGSATGTTEGTDSLTGVNAAQGSSFGDTLLGSNFNNTFTGLGGDDFIDGRGGFDTASYNSMTLATSGIAVEMAAGTVTDNVNNVIGHDTLRNIEGVQGTGYADTFDATGYGLGGALNVSTSNGNFNQFEGLGGDDVITGNGATRVLYSNATGGVNVTIGVNGAGTATGDASTGHDSFTGGVNAAIGSNFADNYDASAFNNGFNSFQGNGGNDTITGNGATQVQYSNATSGVAITIGAGGAGSASGDGSVGTDTFTGVNSAVGGNLNDSYNASAYNGGFNSFQGNGGNDTITGNGATQVQYNNATGGVTVNLSTGTASGDGSVGTDTITGGVNNVLGSNFNDTITGSAGADFLNGNGGNDTISGGGGNDNLNGGFGADTFVYANGGGADFVSDFNRGQGDRIDVTGVTGIFTLADIQAHATQQGPNTVIDFGGGNMITLANVAVGSLVASDFVFNNTVFGTSGNDTLVGTSQIDGIYGMDGNDRLQGLGGNDLLDGGNGFDRAIYTEATGSITVNLAAGTATGAGVGSDTLVSIEGAVGGAFNDTFNAAGFTGSSAQAGVAAGQSGFEGRGGDDVITGQINALGQSVTRVEYLGASAAVTVDLAAGTGQGTAAGDLANVGHDTFTNALQGVFGSAFNDTIYGSDNANFTYEAFEGRAGNDYIDGRGGYDIVAYNNDPATTAGITVNLAAGTVTGDGTIGTDTLRNVEAVRGTNFDDVFDTTGYGAPGALNASTTNGNFNDIAGAGGNDSIIGNGNTRLNYSIAQAAVTVDLETTAGTALTVAGSATGTTEGTDTFTGVNAVQASIFNDTLLGSSYNNTFTPLGGDDYMDGRGGFDTASYNNLNMVTGGIAVAMAAGTVTGDASIGHDTLRNIEGVQGTGYADTFDATGYGLGGALNVSTSNGNFNQFEGLGGDDVITGNGATRVLYSNATGGVNVTIGVNGAGTATGDASTGHDSFTGGVNAAIGSNFADNYDASAFNNGFNSFQGNGGNDTITGNGATQVQYSNATSGVVITIGAGGAGSASGDGSVGTDTFTGVNSAVGGNLNDSYNASAYNGGFNSFQGNGGNDTITGNGATQVQYNNATGGVTVNLSAGTASGDGSVGTDTITGGVNNVVGSNFNDTITGSAGADFLSGNGGNDTILGGGGNDNLSGGLGADTFVYANGGGADFVSDFNRGQGDRIDVTGVTGIFTLADIQAHASQQGPNTVIDFGGGNMITLANIAVGSLVATDFVFNNTVIGTSGNDTLVGTSQIDGIYGMDGNDRLQGLGSNDLLDGGNGFDRAVYTEATGSITVNLAAGTASGAGVGSDTLVSIEGAVGGAFNDTFNAAGFTGSSAQPGVAAGQSGFEGRGGDDVITGQINALGQSVTRVEYLGASAAVTVDLAAGTGQGTAAGDLANVGHDTFTNALQGVFGSAFNDTIYGSDNANFTYEAFEGRAGNDYIDGRGGYDIVAYNNDPATTAGITVNLAAGTVTGDATIGTDTLRNVEAVRGTNFDDVFDTTGYGAPGALNASTTNGNFNDIAGAGGNDSIIGNGNTRLNYSIAQAAVSVDLETTAGTALTVAGSATGTTEGIDTFTGVNAVQASVFNDTLLGSSYNNTFTPLGGDDYMDGRGGFDTASYNNLNTVTGGIAVTMAAGTVTGDASIGHDTLRNIEGVQGTSYADTFDASGYGLNGALNVSTSNGNFNQFEGLGGDDVITGNGATRVLYSNATGGVNVTIGVNGAGTATGDASTGHDSFTGGVNAAIGSNFADSYDASAFNNGFNSFQGNAGNDTITGNGATQVQYSNATSGVVITIGAGGAGSASGDGSVGTDTFTGVNSAVGGNLNDSYNASAYNGGFNSFQGNGGNDTITGNGATQVQYNNATGGVTVNLSAGTASGDGSVGTDTITGGVNNVVGSNFNDTITGSAGADFLNGNGGNDTISGGGGNDNLNGGGGNDNFVFVSGATAGATITDFTGNGASPGDTLEFHGFGLAADGATLTQIGMSNQWLVHSGLDAHEETITINGAVHATDFHFLT